MEKVVQSQRAQRWKEKPFRGLDLAFYVVLVLCADTLLFTQNQTNIDPALQGSWVVVGGEHEGKTMDTLDGGTMIVEKEKFEIRTNKGNVLKGTLRLDQTQQPNAMDLIHQNGTQWEAIYSVDQDEFKLNYVEAGQKDKRPATFKTSADTEASLVFLTRMKEKSAKAN